jgi:hypothetical protein
MKIKEIVAWTPHSAVCLCAFVGFSFLGAYWLSPQMIFLQNRTISALYHSLLPPMLRMRFQQGSWFHLPM